MTKFSIDISKIEDYKKEYKETHCVFLPSFIEQTALTHLIDKLEQTEFYTKSEKDEHTGEFGKVLFMSPDSPVPFMFHMLMNNPVLFNQLEEITGCDTIGNFTGRIHRSAGGEEHQIEWHGDNSDTRLLAMTLNLGRTSYTGAKFQIRKKGEDKIIREFGQTEPGDAFIFEIHPELQHRLSLVETGTRTVGVGWFRAEPDYNTFARQYFMEKK